MSNSYSQRLAVACVACTALVVLALLLCPASAAAELTSAGILDDVLTRYHDAAKGWSRRVQGAATTLFWSLAIISMVWTFGEMAMRRADPMEVLAEFVRFMFVLGFFWWLLANAVPISESIITSLRQLGAEASGAKNALTPSSIVDVGLEIVFKVIDQSSIWSPGDSAVGLVIALAILIALAIVAVNMLVLLVTSWFLIYAGVLYLGFGGSRWTSDMAIGYYKTVLSIGMQLLAMVLLVGIGQSFLDGYYAKMSEGVKLKEMVVMLLVAFCLAAVCNKVPSLLSSVASGMSPSHALGHGVGAGTMIGAAGVAAAAASTGAAMVVSAGANIGGGVQAMRAATGAARAELSGGAAMGSSGGGMGPLASALGEKMGSSSSGASLQRASSSAGTSSGASANPSQNARSSTSTGDKTGASASKSTSGAETQKERGARGSQDASSGRGGASGEGAKSFHRSGPPQSVSDSKTSGEAGRVDTAVAATEDSSPSHEASSDEVAVSSAPHTQSQEHAVSGEPDASSAPASGDEGESSTDAQSSATAFGASEESEAGGTIADPNDPDTGRDAVGQSTAPNVSPHSVASSNSPARDTSSARGGPAVSTPQSRDSSGGSAMSGSTSAVAAETSARPAAQSGGDGHSQSSSSMEGSSGSASPASTTAPSRAEEAQGLSQGHSSTTPARANESAGGNAGHSAGQPQSKPSSLKVAARATQILAQATASHVKAAAIGAAQRHIDGTLGGKIAAAIRSNEQREAPTADEVRAFSDQQPSAVPAASENALSAGTLNLDNTGIAPSHDD